MTNRFNTLALTALLGLGSGPVGADVLLLDTIHAAPANMQGGMLRPITGQSMATVESIFGAASNTVPAVGDPPITRWGYPGFTVYFEHDRVIHSVVLRPAP